MNRLLNLNEVSVPFIVVIALFTLLLPALLYLLFLFLGMMQVQWLFLITLMRSSVGLGFVLLGVLLVLIIDEQIQDRAIVRVYDRNRSKRLNAPGGLFECQYCGNRRVRAEQHCCEICGKTLE